MLMTAALLTSLTLLAGTARSDEFPKPPVGGKKGDGAKAGKKLNAEELGEMLEMMGYDPKPAKNKNGEVVGYHLTMQSDGITMYCTIEVSQNGQVIWVYGSLAPVVDQTCPSEVLLAMLQTNLRISPAAINYSPVTKKFEVLLTLANTNMTPAGMKTAINQFSEGVKQALMTWQKATTEKVKDPTPLP
jgi:hypothetical protein